MSYEEDNILKILSLRVDDAAEEAKNILPISPTAGAILDLQEQIDDLRRTLNKLIRILKNWDGGGK